MIAEQINQSLDYEVDQQTQSIKFQTGYEYVSDRLAASIFKHVTDDFILPAYVQKYYQRAAKATHQKDQHLLNYKFIDQKVLKKINGYELDFLLHDKQQSQRIKEISKKNLEKQNMKSQKQIPKNEKQKQNIKAQHIDAKNKSQDIQDQKRKQYILKNQKHALEDTFYTFSKEIIFIDCWQNGLKTLKQLLKQPKFERLFKSIQCRNLINVVLFYSENESNKTKDTNYLQMKKCFFFLIRFQQEIKQGKLNPFEQKINQKRPKQNMRIQEQRYERDFIIQFNDISSEIYQIQINFYGKSVQMTNQGFIKVDQNNLKDPKIKLIDFNIKGMSSFTKILPQKKKVFIQCEALDYKNFKNQVNYFFKGFQFQQNRRFGFKHYDLAFQGGGAKGLAYVGAYKALKQNKIDGKQIQIGSIMGSSAGGITAIAASTGISHRQIEQLCYKMDDIPKEDKITCEDEAFDEYGNKITFPRVEAKLRELFTSFGILNEQTFDQIAKLFKEKINDMGQDILSYLKIAAPNIASIFDSEKKVQKTEGWLFWKKSVLKHQINWGGIFLHGALMKGESIYKISAQCLVKYLLKLSYRPLFKQKIEDAFVNYEQNHQKLHKIDTNKIVNLLEEYKQLHIQILNSPIQKLWGQLEEKQQSKQQHQRYINESIICVVNKFMILMNQFLELDQKKSGLNITQLKLSKKLCYSPKFKFKRQKIMRIISKIKQSLSANLESNDFNQQLNSLCKELSYEEKQVKTGQVSTKQYIYDVIQKEKKFLQTITRLQKYFKQGKIGQHNQQESIAYYFKFMYFYTQIQQIIQMTTQQKQIYQIQLKLRKIKNIDQILSCNTYSQINSQTNLVNLLNDKHFTQKQENKEGNTAKYIAQIFQGSYDKDEVVFQIQSIQKLIKSKNEPEQLAKIKLIKIEFLFELCEQIDKIAKRKQFKTNLNGIFYRRHKNFQELIKEASKITMKQYYNLNPIQVTCTSVDLDNKILRLFNHKTTPDLPICRAVQMTGSFPFAFKALRWKQQWGYYYVHHENKKAAINIVGHEFTDGGLLANFPIKYIDNRTIRRCYFSHAQQKHNSILLGFGLDQLKQGSYHKAAKEVQQEYKQNIQKQLAFKRIQKHFTSWFKLKEGVKIFFNSRWFNFGQKQQQWESFNIKLLQQIPILRFLTKVFSSYPNADRNLNLQAFSQEIMVQKANDVSTININQMIIMNAMDTKKKQQMKKAEWRCKIQRCFEQFKLFKNVIVTNKRQQKQTQDNDPRWQKAFSQINRHFQDQKQVTKSMISGFKTFFSKKTNQPDKECSLNNLLIKMLQITLKTKTNNNQNKKVNEILSNRFMYLSLISKKLQKYNNQLQDTSLKSQIKDIKKELNIRNMQFFYKKNNFEEIQRRGDFYQLKKQYLIECGDNQLDKNYQIEVSKIKQKYKDNFETIQIEIKKLYQQNLQKKQKLWKKIQEKLHNNPQANLFDFQITDITFSFKRMIKYLYLQIKAQKIMNKQQLKNCSSVLTENSKLQNILMKNYKKFTFLNHHQKRTFYLKLDNPESKNYLTFNEIFQFLCFLKDHGVYKDNKCHKIQYQWQFQQYLQNLKSAKPQLRYMQKVQFSLDLYAQNIEERSLESMRNHLLNKESQQSTIARYKMVQNLCEEKSKKMCDNILLSEQISQIAVQKMNQQNTIQHLKKILHNQSKEQMEQFMNFLFYDLKFKKSSPISIQNDIYVRNLRQQTKKHLKNVIYGQYLQNQRKVRDKIKMFKKSMNNYKKDQFHQLSTNQFQYINQNERYFIMQTDCLTYFFFKMIKKYFQGKLLMNNQKQQQFCSIHKVYVKDIQHLFAFLRKMILLVADFQKSYQECKDEDYQYQSSFLFKEYKTIFFQFTEGYMQMALLLQNEITIQKLEETFLIKYRHISFIISLIKKIVQNFNIRAQRKNQEKRQLFQKIDLKLYHISQKIIEFNDYKFCLPLFAEDWQHLVKVNKIPFFTKYRLLYLEDTYYKRYQRTISSIFQNKRNKQILRKKLSQKKQAPKVHLILQGAASSNEAFCAYFNQIQNSQLTKKQNKRQNKKQNKGPNFDIRMITSSNLFGFLMCLGQDIEQTRKDMYRTRNYLFEMFNPQKIVQSYQKHTPSVSLNDYNVLAEHYKIQLLNVMRIFQQKYQQQSGKISYLKKFNDIRLIVEQQQQYYMETCNQILDAAAQQIEDIQNKYLNFQKANQIAKKFGYDYSCSFNKRHQYSKYNKQCKQLFNYMMVEYYQQFGSIVSAITCNFINNKIPFIINLDNAQSFTKGFMVARLMTTYKLKAFIFKKLKEHGFPYDITLKQFYERCKNKIIINFMVVNMTKKRMEFLNKITTPKMPVWAAILAASSIPSLHRCFQSQRQWESLKGQQFKAEEMISFFKEHQVLKKYTLYNSAMLISSIPMQMLTNNTFISRFRQLSDHKQQQNLKDLHNIGFAFNQTYSSNLFHMKLEKKYFNLSFGILRLVKKLMFDYHQLIATQKQQKHRLQHYNRSYDVNHYNPIAQLKALLFHENVPVKILQTLVQSNDNLVMKWYFNRLIRLPIKISTLSFNDAVDQQVFKKYRLKVPSEKAKDALNRSYQITKTFIYDIQNRFKYNKLQYNQKRSTSKSQRFLVQLRAEFIQKADPSSGLPQQYIKVTFLNYSKWNQNMYNNLVIEYRAQRTSQFQRCQNSEVIWKNQEGPMLRMKFYYFHYSYLEKKDQMIGDEDYFTTENSRIMRSKFFLDFGNIVNYSHKNSYDYQFVCGWNQQQEQLSKSSTQNKANDWKKMKLLKMNGIKVKEPKDLPQMKVKHDTKTKYPKNKYCEEYIKDSQYRMD